jgi:hypothetical protein
VFLYHLTLKFRQSNNELLLRSVKMRVSPISRSWQEPGQEPGLVDVLADPIVHLVMRRDGVSQAELRAVISRAQARLGDCLCRCAA